MLFWTNASYTVVMQKPQVGVGVCIVKNGKVLFGKRLNAHGDGSWSFPGGHLEPGESWEQCATREVAEETGIIIDSLQFITATNDVFKAENKHYVTIFMQAKWASGSPQVLEPHKMVEWQWVAWNDLPQPVFLPVKNLLDSGFQPGHTSKKR